MQIVEQKPTTLKQAKQGIGGSIGKPSKMPGFAYGISAFDCITGSRLALIPGSVCESCYGKKNNYVYPSVQIAHARRLAAWEEPGWVESMVYVLDHEYRKLAPIEHYHRWFDDGDLQSLPMLRKIVAVCERLPWVAFWLPTKEYSIVKSYRMAYGEFPANLTVRLSAHMIDGKTPDGYGLPTSAVFSRSVQTGHYECPAPTQDGHCGQCRACWNRGVQTTSYHQH